MVLRVTVPTAVADRSQIAMLQYFVVISDLAGFIEGIIKRQAEQANNVRRLTNSADKQINGSGKFRNWLKRLRYLSGGNQLCRRNNENQVVARGYSAMGVLVTLRLSGWLSL